MSISEINATKFISMPDFFSKLLGGRISDHFQDDCPFKNQQGNAFIQGINGNTSFTEGISIDGAGNKIDTTA